MRKYLVNKVADCNECDWCDMSRMATSRAKKHAIETGHLVIVESVYRSHFEFEVVPAGQPTKEEGI